MIKRNLFLGIFFLGFVVFANAQNSNGERNLHEFNVNGIKIGTTLKKFLDNQSSSFEEITSGVPSDEKHYTSSKLSNTKECTVKFKNDKVYDITLVYSADESIKMGGWHSILSNLEKSYGKKFDIVSQNDAPVWEGYISIFKIDRSLYASASSDELILEYADIKEIFKKKSKKN